MKACAITNAYYEGYVHCLQNIQKGCERGLTLSESIQCTIKAIQQVMNPEPPARLVEEFKS